jgi:hypothetical protein
MNCQRSKKKESSAMLAGSMMWSVLTYGHLVTHVPIALEEKAWMLLAPSIG